MRSKKPRLIITACITLLLTGCANTVTASDAKIEELSTEIADLQQTLDSYIDQSDNEYNIEYYTYSVISPDSMKSDIYDTSNDLIVKLENITDNHYSSLDATVVFYDSEDQMIGTQYCYFWDVFGGATVLEHISRPYDEYYNAVAFDHFEVLYKGIKAEAYETVPVDTIDVIHNKALDQGVLAKCTNNSGQSLIQVSLSIEYYYQGNMIGYEQASIYNSVPGSAEVVSFPRPYDSMGNALVYDTYNIIVNQASVSGPVYSNEFSV